MKFTRLVPANHWEVEKWLAEKLELTPYQKEKMSAAELIRFSPFKFYSQPKKEVYSIWWRLTLIVYPFYLLAIIVFNPIKWIFTGKWGYGQKFLDKFHYKWCKRLDL